MPMCSSSSQKLLMDAYVSCTSMPTSVPSTSGKQLQISETPGLTWRPKFDSIQHEGFGKVIWKKLHLFFFVPKRGRSGIWGED